jgi:biotin-dependent carboxylase-like uncharacterized protein
MIEVLDAGPLSTVQDLGRRGHAALGVPVSGAFDRAALRLANRLVGNAENAAAIEVTLGGLRLRTDRAVTVALTGAECPGVAWGAAVSLPAGAVLELGRPASGLRSYLAVRGGVDGEPMLGSRSTDTLSGLGPAPLTAGTHLHIGRPTQPVSGAFAPGRPAGGRVPVLFGPRDDWFTAAARHTLLDTPWRVRAASDRVGVRLDGPALVRSRTGELPSEAVLPGAVQVPGDGRPIVFGPDAPVTGGYPVIAVVLEPDLLAQLRPGDEVRFTPAR